MRIVNHCFKPQFWNIAHAKNKPITFRPLVDTWFIHLCRAAPSVNKSRIPSLPKNVFIVIAKSFHRGFEHAREEPNLCFLENLKRCYGMVVVINLIQKNVFLLLRSMKQLPLSIGSRFQNRLKRLHFFGATLKRNLDWYSANNGSRLCAKGKWQTASINKSNSITIKLCQIHATATTANKVLMNLLVSWSLLL